eukprot:c8275_g1_i4.p1 GENE.c8275_g1_i4~~c8275_g1_i4.p1  ORF type:complete len:658 (-),score=146.06 c8275_g1_i4:27-1814(-)
MGTVFTSVAVNVQTVSVVYASNTNTTYLKIAATGMPNYTFPMDTATVNWLNSRPKASSDFTTGQTTAIAGTTYNFGDNINYNNNNCAAGSGRGWWPPGPMCPGNQNKVRRFPLNPVKANEEYSCSTQMGEIGTLINGVALFDWQDGNSYNSAKAWTNVAMKFELYDMDVCIGHAAGTNYHHHYIPNCLSMILKDDGSKHSPLYGYAADGFPIYGPYQRANQKAQSCWKTRDYSATSSTGCGTDGARTCKLKDQYDASKGTTVLSSSNYGPTTNGSVSSLSGNTISTVSGAYFEDYYYNSSCTSQGSDYLDSSNGHDHDGLGYHYHLTETFPYVLGPKFYGALFSGGFVTCSKYQDTASNSTTVATPSNTASRSPSVSRSPTTSFSPSRSPTTSLSPSRSPTRSLSNSRSPSVSVSPSRRETPSTSGSPSTTSSVSPSTSVTPTTTRTSTVTTSVSPSPTVTPSETRSSTVTPSETRSPTVTPSETASSTVTPSETASSTITPTQTRSPTKSRSTSRSPSTTTTPSVTSTRSRTPSRTTTRSITPSRTPSLSRTPSRTPTISISPTKSPSRSVSPTVSPSREPTPSRTPSRTPPSV